MYRVAERRYDHEDELQAKGPLQPQGGHVDVIDASEPLPDELVRRIIEALADETHAETDE